MEWRQFVEPSITVLRGLRCAICSVCYWSSDLSSKEYRNVANYLIGCEKNTVGTYHQYHSGARDSSKDQIEGVFGRGKRGVHPLVEGFVRSVKNVTDYVLDESGRVFDPYIYWRLSLLINPYLVWSYHMLRNGIGYIVDGGTDFLVPLRAAIGSRDIPIPGDRHVHFESSLYPDDLLSILLTKDIVPYYSKAKKKIGDGRRPPRDHAFNHRLRSVEKEWDSFPHYTLAHRGKEMWQSMIISLWEFFVNLSYDLMKEDKFFHKKWCTKGKMLLLGGYSDIPKFINYDFPKLTRCLFDIVWRGYTGRDRSEKPKWAAVALIASSLIWASFGDTKVEGLKDFASGIYSHPLKEIAKSVRKEYVKSYVGRFIPQRSTIMEYYVRSIHRRIGDSGKDLELRVSLVDDAFRPTKIDNTLLPIYKRLSASQQGNRQNSSMDMKLDVVLHYIKMGSEKEKYQVLDEVFGGKRRGKSTVERWVNETEQTFLYVYHNRRNISQIEIIAGFDAASDEMWTPVWLLAPFFRFWYVGVGAYMNRLNLRFRKMTFHAGEDFLDVVSGIRRMFDVSIMVSDFGMGRSRMGHAIAFGVDPFHMGIGNSTVTVFDYFMNVWFLLYLYEKYIVPNDYPVEYKGVVKKAMKKILSQIYSDIRKDERKQNQKRDKCLSVTERMMQYSTDDWMVMYEYLFRIGGMFLTHYFKSPVVRKIWEVAMGIRRLRGDEYACRTLEIMKMLSGRLSREIKGEAKHILLKKILVSPIFPVSIMSPGDQEKMVDMLSVVIRENMKKVGAKPEVCVTSNMLIRDIRDPFAHPWVSNYANEIGYDVGTDNPLFTLSIPDFEEYLIKRRR